ncbi:MAG: energy-coupling factor ABC transporter permease [Gammaproteobacteria bacterium]|nr:energy-coupling factor ABC transporter permease [Gammaproteobacteria bacterium]
MDIPANLLPMAWLLGGGVLYGLVLMAALLTAPWSRVRDSEAQNVYLAAIVAISLMWVMRGGIQAGLSYHLLGMTLLCLMFEWQFAVFAASLIVAFTSWQGGSGWAAFGVNVMLMGVLPILFTRVMLYICQRHLPHNYYIYVFVNAFLVGALSMLLAGGASGLLQLIAGVQPAGTISSNFLMILPMLMFGEAFINGGTLSLVVAYRPQWVATFHDRWYLDGK